KPWITFNEKGYVTIHENIAESVKLNPYVCHTLYNIFFNPSLFNNIINVFEQIQRAELANILKDSLTKIFEQYGIYMEKGIVVKKNDNKLDFFVYTDGTLMGSYRSALYCYLF